MNYIQLLANKICSEIPEDVLPTSDNLNQLMLIYAVLALSKGESVSNKDVHDAWAAWMSLSDSEHKSIKPFNELESSTQDMDKPFTEAIRRAVKAQAL